MGSDPTAPTLDEIVLALRLEDGETPAEAVLDLTVADLVSDSSTEIVDLSNILAGQGQSSDNSDSGIELIAVQSDGFMATHQPDASEPVFHSSDSSILYTVLSFPDADRG